LAKALPDIIMYPCTEVQGNSVASSSKEENDKWNSRFTLRPGANHPTGVVF